MFHNILKNEGKNLTHKISQFLRLEWAYYSSFLGFRAQATRVSYKPVSYLKKYGPAPCMKIPSTARTAM